MISSITSTHAQLYQSLQQQSEPVEAVPRREKLGEDGTSWRAAGSHTPHRRTSARHVLHLLAHHARPRRLGDDWVFGAITRFADRVGRGWRVSGTVCQENAIVKDVLSCVED